MLASKTLVAAALTILFSPVVTNAAPQVNVPPPGLFCCPSTGPNGWPLLERQIGPFYIYCIYGEGDNTVGCYYDPATGTGSTIPGCPPQAVPNTKKYKEKQAKKYQKHPLTCPI